MNHNFGTSRRDSFITHRAFCDALAEETARVKAASDINIINPIIGAASNIGYHFVGGPNNMTQHFPSVFKPISSNDDATTARGLSLWMGGQDQTIMGSPNNTNALQDQIRHHHNHQQLGSVCSASGIFGTDHLPLVSCPSSNHPPPSDYHHNHHHLNWVFGSSTNKISSNNNAHEELTMNTCSLPMSNNVNKDGAGNQLVSVPSLYSTQLSSTNSHSVAVAAAANMSATALLQKAAQIGATSSVDSSFLGSFGLKCNNSTCTTTQVQDGNNNKSCGLYGSTLISSIGSHVISINNNNVENPDGEILQIYPPTAKRRHVQSTTEEVAGGQTRDFLGVGGGSGGVQTICHPAAAAAASSINGWI